MSESNISMVALQENQFIITMLEDGSWQGMMLKYGKIIQIREAKPEDCLTRLLTHDGQDSK